MRNLCVCILLLQNLYFSLGGTITSEQPAVDSSDSVSSTTTTTTTHAPKLRSSHEDDVVPHHNTLVNAGDSVWLNCTVNAETISTMRWFKGSEQIKDDDTKNYVLSHHSLQVLKADSKDVGEYSCIIDIGGKPINTTVVLYSPPQVKHFDPNTKNLVQGDPLVLECNMWGWPHPVISWEFNDTVLNANVSNRIKITPNSHGVPDAKLRLENVDYPDGGEYSCTGKNLVNGESMSNSSTITVQIKNKYAALWPFLGICLEVAILCTIIFIYERRHAKKLAEEEEEQAKQEEAEHLASNNEKKEFDDIRHRDVKS